MDSLNNKYFLAVDIGASSGRHIIGWIENGNLRTEEVYRFPNGVVQLDGHLTWDIEALESHVKQGIDKALEKYDITSLSVDTWGVDYVLMDGDKPILPCYSYRDDRTEETINAVHELIPFAALYARSGCQFQKFNTIYQLYTDKIAGRLDKATGLLMVPEYLMYKLTGVMAREYTNATTTGIFNQKEKEYDREIIEKLGLKKELFTSLSKPGTVIGSYKGIDVVLCATHDTASAVEGIPMDSESEPYISSGTWSLLGVKTSAAITSDDARKANFSNEGGPEYNRFQKNIMGMWIINRLKEEIAGDRTFDEIVESAKNSCFSETVDVNAECFLAPKSMKEVFDKNCSDRFGNDGDYFRCAYRSLALGYKQAINELKSITGGTYSRLYIVGGGAKNILLNNLTEEMTGLQVIALPIEATALGNLKIQIERYK